MLTVLENLQCFCFASRCLFKSGSIGLQTFLRFYHSKSCLRNRTSLFFLQFQQFTTFRERDKSDVSLRRCCQGMWLSALLTSGCTSMCEKEYLHVYLQKAYVRVVVRVKINPSIFEQRVASTCPDIRWFVLRVS